MSGIYIPGMEMPKDGFVEIIIHNDGAVMQTGQSYRVGGTDYYTPYIGEMPIVFAAIPVPDRGVPVADVIEEESILKFYYVRSLDEYWIGQRVGNFYYAEYEPKIHQWVWTHSRYLEWGEHVVDPSSLWKEHTYPSEPEEMPFGEWLEGFIKKHFASTGKMEEVDT